jgi:hypothetical protein
MLAAPPRCSTRAPCKKVDSQLKEHSSHAGRTWWSDGNDLLPDRVYRPALLRWGRRGRHQGQAKLCQAARARVFDFRVRLQGGFKFRGCLVCSGGDRPGVDSSAGTGVVIIVGA